MDDYYQWLVSLVGNKNPFLLKTLYSIPYHYDIPLDSNRYQGGLSMRNQFLYKNGYDPDEQIGPDFVSVLEVLVRLSVALEFETDIPQDQWFWEMMQNLGVNTSLDADEISNSVERWMDHKYSYNGVGSLFPLRDAKQDTRTVQLWAQMSMYINENYGKNYYI